MANYQHIRMHGLGDVLREHRRSRPHLTAVVDGDLRFTWPEFDARVNRLARLLQAEGVSEGGRVLWLGQNSFRLLEGILACAKLGALFCPVNWRQSASEIAFVISDFSPHLVIWQDTDVGALFAEARALSEHRCTWLQHDDTGPAGYEARLQQFDDTDIDLDVSSDAPVVAMYTAAFDGRPNAALLAQSALLYQSLMTAYGFSITEASSYLNSGPLFHLGTMMSTMATFVFGAKNIFIARVDAEDMLRIFAAEKVTHAFVVQPTLEQIRTINKEGKYDTSSLWSAPSAPEWKSPMVMPVNAPFNQQPRVYGQTEVMGFLTYGWMGGEGAGRPGPLAQVRLVDNAGNECAVGQPGEIEVRGVQVMSGYYNRDTENTRRTQSGWHKTNDLGKRLDDGAIAFVGPKTTMIKSGVENIYPAEVEACVRELAAVQDVCVIGVPDPKWDQNVKALVVLKAGQELTADAIIDHCKQRMASYKKPKIVEFIAAVPRSADGMVDRAQADALYGGGGYPVTA
jgi:long-chain acyl-CoA synthetase